MSDTNGANPKPEWLERLERVEASHIKVMTDFEVFAAEHAKFVKEQDERGRALDKRLDRMEAHEERIDERIDKLVSGIGALAAIKLDGKARKKTAK
jgi:chaperonin cofactor prefoldin